MRRFISFFLLFAANAFFLRPASAQSTTTEPVGFTTVTLAANSDTLIAMPVTRPPEFTGTVQSISGNVITVSGTRGWATNQFVYAAGAQPKTYFVLIGGGGASNPKEGHTYLITANGINTLTVDTSADPLTGITASTQLIVIPYWTLATIFPPSDANVSFTPTTSTFNYKTQILVPNNAAMGTNLPVTTYFFSNNVNGTTGNIGWRLGGPHLTSVTPTADRGDDPLPPNSYFIVRNLNGAPKLPLKGIGGVLTKKLVTPLRTSAVQAQDNAVSLVRPVDVTLKQTGLNPDDGSFVAFKDQLLLFDNSVAGFDKQPSGIYYYSASPGEAAGWRRFDDGLADHSNDLIPAGSAMVIRKAKTSAGATVFWTNVPTY